MDVQKLIDDVERLRALMLERGRTGRSSRTGLGAGKAQGTV
ncbi:MAG: hypothetical protein ACLTTP_03780 [Alistipes ihumii]